MSLTRNESRASYAIIRHNIRTYEFAVEVIEGRQHASITAYSAMSCPSSFSQALQRKVEHVPPPSEL